MNASRGIAVTVTLITIGLQATIAEGNDAPRTESALERSFDSLLTPANLSAWMKEFASHAHHAGSPYSKPVAERIAGLFRSWGYETAIEEFQVLYPRPVVREFEMTAPERYSPALRELPIPEDPTSGQTGEQLPLYNIYSVDGDVSGQLVYVNYGVPKDYEELERRGVDVRGKIAIARYGGSWRGIKPKVAAQHGAIGCIIFSDPRDDGYYQGDVYPKGAYRNETGGQRGSVQDMPIHTGDPLTPFVGATKDAKRISLKDAQILTKIPVMPISYGDALPLLRAMGGPVAPAGWRGALPITYHLGPGPTTVHLNLKFSWDLVPIYDVIAKLPGKESPDEWIIRGNHHDAWVYGADDPLSGLVAMMEEARAIGALVRSGWQPRRTIVYCAWDAEEPGLIGSTEWVETHADELSRKAVVYINSDGNGRGYLGAGGSHAFEELLNDVARSVIDPEKHVSVAERLRARQLVGANVKERAEIRERRNFRIYPLGSGSDYTPFLQHLGIASLNIGYGGEDGGGSYHSIFDSYDHYRRFGDPGFQYGIVQAQTTGRIVMRLAGSEVLPFRFSGFTETVARYADQVMKLADDMRKETDEMNRLIRERAYDLSSDPKELWVTPALKDSVPYLNFAPLQNAIAHLRAAVSAFDDQWKRVDSAGRKLSPASVRSLNAMFRQFEHTLTIPGGLPGRPWYIHAIYAPGQYTGYGVKTLPGIRESIELRKWGQADEQITVAAKVLEGSAAFIARSMELIR
ncbi:MAG: M28 family metallopeptidase [Bacteroidota bacterium]